MAEVWEAGDEVLGRPVAIKVLHPQFASDATIRARFQVEAVAAARLVHPTIVSIYDTVEVDGRDAIVMELVRGRTLREFLDERGRLEPIEVIHIGEEVSVALAVAHRAGVIHRDIKPGNILLGDDGRVIVTDFGIAKLLDEPDLTRTAQLLGTVKYLAPEQVEGGPVDGRTDIYALGAVLYEALCGEPPFRAETPAALALARMHRDPVRPSTRVRDVPADLDATIMRALSRPPIDRFETANDLRAALASTRLDVPADAARTGAASATPSGRSSDGSHRTRGRSGIVIAAIIVAALVVIALLVANTSAGRELFSESTTTTTEAAPAAVAISSTHSFDPSDRNGGLENEDAARSATDADALTAWSTDEYATRTFGNLKTGVGLVVDLTERASIAAVRIDSPTRDWSVEIRVADGSPSVLADWGPVVGSATTIDRGVTIDLHGTTGDSILVWITDLGSGPPFRATITDILVTASPS